MDSSKTSTRSKRLRGNKTEAAEPESKRSRTEEAEDDVVPVGDGSHEENHEEVVESDGGEKKEDDSRSHDKSGEAENTSDTRWQAHQMAEDYVELASEIVLEPLSQLGSFGYEDNRNDIPLEVVSALGYLKSPTRPPSIIERWSPYEIALFEAALARHGKDFLQVNKIIETKTTKEIIDFYYIWKKTSHYQKWKSSYVPPHMDVSDDEEGAK